MVLRLNQELSIENLRNHPHDEVEKLRALLTAGADVEADPHRENFYEVPNGRRVFYIHISPATGKVWLLASWLKEPPGRESGA
jgi:hypothetical protein